jgi:hypothetical protein
MSIVNPNVELRVGGFLEAMRYSLENKACCVMAFADIPPEQGIDAASEALLVAAMKELDVTEEEFQKKMYENTVRLCLGGYWPMGTAEYFGHINEFTASHEVTSVIFVASEQLVKDLSPKVTLQ